MCECEKLKKEIKQLRKDHEYFQKFIMKYLSESTIETISGSKKRAYQEAKDDELFKNLAFGKE